MNEIHRWFVDLTPVWLVALVFLQIWILRARNKPILLEKINEKLFDLSNHIERQSFVLEETQRQIRLLGQDFEQRQTSFSQQVQASLAQSRSDTQQVQSALQQALVAQMGQNNHVQTEKLNQFSETLHRTNTVIQEQLTQIRQSVEQKLKDLQEDNSSKLELMRKTVDEKLHATLEQRLGESFKQVSDRLEAVYVGLGEMRALAAGVGDLKRVLTNVKTRGTWGEVQLRALLEQMLTPSQFGQNIKPIPGNGNIVEFAVRLPGQNHDEPVWLPIDSKFPKEQYERLMDAFDRADPEAASLASKALEKAIRDEARSISEKYLAPPYTTDFGILFLPTEGLYAEVVKRPGLVDELQRVHRVTVAGPTTLSALLNALQLGFKTLALEKRSSEVWSILSAVKTEFAKFGDILAKTRNTLEKAARDIELAETRTRVMHRKLKGVDELPTEQALIVLGLDSPEDIVDEQEE